MATKIRMIHAVRKIMRAKTDEYEMNQIIPAMEKNRAIGKVIKLGTWEMNLVIFGISKTVIFAMMLGSMFSSKLMLEAVSLS